MMGAVRFLPEALEDLIRQASETRGAWRDPGAKRPG